ncbi:ABC transporter permease [Paraburkholderia tropica]|uniref:Erythritol transport system permease protein n=1 Tax=Paraburkholderia tropica TaxID=92647 RepID=A0AAQ1GJ40_9BURK|nr:ABC transporter permease [Paraburkholderia tropica]QNB14893.1 ABC transporter permease [Paraburkholderia tropica]RQN35012.1 ABC transporter permease [Paraburkholderia tropica]SEK02902.1 erythritol transport system permease protein [Paraburkholderia tropica]
MNTPNSSNPSLHPVHTKHNRQSAYMVARFTVNLLKLRIFIALFVIFIVFSLTADNFLSASNMLIMAKHVTVVAILSIGMTLVILTGGIDLSVGSIVGISGMAAGYLLLQGVHIGHYVVFFNPLGVALLACVLGALIGAVNGYLITALNVAPFIATLGMLYVVRGAALLVNNGSTYADLEGNPALGNTGFEFIGNGTIMGLSVPVWIMLLLAAVTIFIARKTPLGRRIYAIGGNEQAARFSGIRTNRVKLFVYTFSGFCGAIVGLVITAQLQTAHPLTGETYELNAIAAVVLGGTALMGGRGTVFGSVVGACVISILGDGMVMCGISDFWQMVIKGLVIIFAVVVDQLQQRLQSRMVAMTA